MGHRLSRIVTRTGDDGSTGLGDGTRAPKDAARIVALGELDELNSAIGCVLAEGPPSAVAEALGAVQNDLFDLGGEVCIPGRIAMTEAHVARLEARVGSINAVLPALKEFVLPGGSRAAATCHLARAVCRRAERALVSLSRSEHVPAVSLRYLNRLSDLLFVCARATNRAAGAAEPQWKPSAP